VQIRVNDVDAHVAGAGDANERVEIRAVAVQIRALAVKDVRHRANLALENAERVRNGDHQRGDILVDCLLQDVQIHRSSAVRLQLANFVAGESGRRWIGAVRRIGDQNVFARVAALRQRFVNHQNAGELTVRAGHRLQRHPRHSQDRLQRLLEVPQQLEISLHLMIGLQRM